MRATAAATLLLLLLLLLLTLTLTALTKETHAARSWTQWTRRLRRALTADADAGACGVTVLTHTRVPWFDKPTNAMEEPQTHPGGTDMCASFAGKPSCCTLASLEAMRAWSNATQAFTRALLEQKYLVQSSPGSVVDLIVTSVHNALPADPNVDWRGIREAVRPDGIALANSFAAKVVPAMEAAWHVSVAYMEGLLCSACAPNAGSTFLDTTAGTISMFPDAAQRNADAFVRILQALDEFLGSSEGSSHIRSLADKACMAVFKGDRVKCGLVPTITGVVLGLVTGVELRVLVCGAPTASLLADADNVCRQMFMNRVLRGLQPDVSPLAVNVFARFEQQCKQYSPDKSLCKSLEDSRKSMEANAAFSVDERAWAKNVYVPRSASAALNVGAPLDVDDLACGAHLSSHAWCRGEAPTSAPTPVPTASASPTMQPTSDDSGKPAHNNKAGGGGVSAGGVFGVAVLSSALTLVAVALVTRRERVQEAASDACAGVRRAVARVRGGGGASAGVGAGAGGDEFSYGGDTLLSST